MSPASSREDTTITLGSAPTGDLLRIDAERPAEEAKITFYEDARGRRFMTTGSVKALRRGMGLGKERP